MLQGHGIGIAFAVSHAAQAIAAIGKAARFIAVPAIAGGDRFGEAGGILVGEGLLVRTGRRIEAGGVGIADAIVAGLIIGGGGAGEIVVGKLIGGQQQHRLTDTGVGLVNDIAVGKGPIAKAPLLAEAAAVAAGTGDGIGRRILVIVGGGPAVAIGAQAGQRGVAQHDGIGVEVGAGEHSKCVLFSFLLFIVTLRRPFTRIRIAATNGY